MEIVFLCARRCGVLHQDEIYGQETEKRNLIKIYNAGRT